MAKLTEAQRKSAPHAGPGNSFPIPDKKHAILALQMRKFAANPSSVVAKVKAKFPDVGGSLLAKGLKK